MVSSDGGEGGGGGDVARSAAVVVQAWWRGVCGRREAKKIIKEALVMKHRAATTIQVSPHNMA